MLIITYFGYNCKEYFAKNRLDYLNKWLTKVGEWGIIKEDIFVKNGTAKAVLQI